MLFPSFLGFSIGLFARLLRRWRFGPRLFAFIATAGDVLGKTKILEFDSTKFIGYVMDFLNTCPHGKNRICRMIADPRRSVRALTCSTDSFSAFHLFDTSGSPTEESPTYRAQSPALKSPSTTISR